MFSNYIKIAIRQLRKQKFYTVLNTTGLAIGIASCLMILLYIQHELSYDQHHQKWEQIYRTALDININEVEATGLAMPAPLAVTLIKDFPEVLNAANLSPYFINGVDNILSLEGEDEGIYQEGFVFIDHSFTEIFDFPHIEGDPNTWLKEPYTLLITEKIAERFFENASPIGKKIILNNDPAEQTYTITGVIEDIPSSSHFEYDYFLSTASLSTENDQQWLFNNYFTYIELREGTTATELAEKLKAFSLKYFGPSFKEQMNLDLADKHKNGEKYDLFLQPLSEIHLYSAGFGPNLKAGGDIRYVRMFGAVGIFLLLIAGINFVNLATARSANRAKEVGVRKVLGSLRKQLIAQFLTESMLVSLFAALLGLGLAYACLPVFNELSGKDIHIPIGATWFIPSLLGLALLLGGLSGVYPALFLSGFRPMEVLRGKQSNNSYKSWLRQGLVIFQFAISAALIIGTLIVYHQMQYIQHKKIGFDKESVLRIEDTYTLLENETVFKTKLEALAEVKNVTISPFLPLEGGYRNSIAFHIEGWGSPEEQIPVQWWPIDDNYLSTLGINLKKGRNFSADRPADSLSVILNEAAVKDFGIENPVGKRLKSSFMDRAYTIIGVVENFHFETLRDKITPLALFQAQPSGTIAVKAENEDMESLLASAEQLWQSFAPGQAFRYTFLDERFNVMYDAENRIAKLLNIFAGLAIAIACLGLFGLATYTAEQRTKEIGIRKVLGASVGSIVQLLSTDFLKLVLIGVGIASPFAYYFMEEWLQDFAYRINIQWWTFLLAGGSAIVIAFVTVSFQSIRAAIANPIKALRSE